MLQECGNASAALRHAQASETSLDALRTAADKLTGRTFRGCLLLYRREKGRTELGHRCAITALVQTNDLA